MPPPSELKTRKKAPPLSMQEESTLKLFYEGHIQSIASQYKFPLSIPATATMYFKRFFVLHSVMSYDPKLVMVTCLNLACKAEEAPITLEGLAKHTGTQVAEVVKWEVAVLQGIQFHMLVFHPYRPLQGLVEALTAWRPTSKASFGQLYQRSLALIQDSYYTDLCLLHAPSQIALAALLKASRDQNSTVVDEYVSVLSEHEPQASFAALQSSITSIHALFIQGAEAIVDAGALQSRCKHITRKLKACSNDLFRMQNAQKHHEKQQRRQKKKEQRRLEDEDQLAALTGTDANRSSPDSGFVIMSRKRMKMTPSPAP